MPKKNEQIIPVDEGTKTKITIRHLFAGCEKIEICLPSGKSYSITISDWEEWIEVTEGESRHTTERDIYASPKSRSQLRIGLVDAHKVYAERQGQINAEPSEN